MSTGTGAREDADAPARGDADRPRAARHQEDAGARHPLDIVRLALGLLGFVVAAVVARQRGMPLVERDLFRLINHLPHRLDTPLAIVMQAGALGAVPVVAALALAARRRRLARDLAASGVIAWVLARLAKELVDRARPGRLLDVVLLRADATAGGLGFPSSHATVAAALATAAGPYVTRRTRRAAWALVALVGLARVYVGAHLPIDVIGGVALGWAVGAAFHLVVGSPGGRAGTEEVEATLADLGMSGVTVRQASVDARGSAPFFATTEGGRRLFVKALGREQRDADLLFRTWRRIQLRHVEDEAPFATAKREVEHEAYLSLLAERAGVRTPAMVTAGEGSTGTAVLAFEQVSGTGLDDIEPEQLTDDVMGQLWAQVSLLRAARIAHRDLRPANILLDAEGRAWMIDFGFAEASASPRRLAQDVAELVASLALTVGPERAVAGAVTALGPDAVGAAVPLLQPLALSGFTRSAMHHRRGLLAQVRQAAADAAGIEDPQLEPLARIRPRTVVMLLFALVGIHLLLPQLGELRRTLDALDTARPVYLFVALLFSGGTYLAAALATLGSVDRPLSYARTVAVQVAASFTNRVTPGSLGGMGVNLRYLERCGLSRPDAISAVALDTVGGALVHVAALAVSAVLLGKSGVGDVRLPEGWPALVIVVVILGLAGFVLWSPLGRRRVAAPAGRALVGIARLLRQPAKALQLFGGSAAITACYVLCFGASLAAFRADVAPVKVAAVYLGASAIASVAPTPGGLGAMEAALAAGLTAVGTRTGPAVAGVLGFRLVSFWLPILPGWLTFRALRRRRVI